MSKAIIHGAGGGILSEDLTATAANVMTGKTYVGYDTGDDIGTGTLALTGTSAAAQVLNGYTFYNTNPQSKLTGTMTNRGAVIQSLAINGTYTIPQGYHSGAGYVTQSITTKSAATYTPSTSAQTIASGQYLSGIQTIAAIPSNWYNVNTQQTVFSYGSYGTVASLGAYGATTGSNSTSVAWTSDSSIPATISSGGINFATTRPNLQRIFRAKIPSALKYLRFSMTIISSTSVRQGSVCVIRPTTLIPFAVPAFSFNSGVTTNTFTFDLSSYMTTLTDGWFLGIYFPYNTEIGIYSMELSPTAF